jgi:hypothetical protein
LQTVTGKAIVVEVESLDTIDVKTKMEDEGGIPAES